VSAVTNTQLGALTSATSYVSISVGGNDAASPTCSPSAPSRGGRATARTATPSPGAASAAGFAFANPTSRFVGHAVCDADERINGLSSPISESYHPKVIGHAARVVGGGW
jgi:hypothetical protein